MLAIQATWQRQSLLSTPHPLGKQRSCRRHSTEDLKHTSQNVVVAGYLL